MRHHFLTALAFTATLAALSPAPALAQDSNFALTPTAPTGQPTAGWTFTPSMLFQTVYDDNVLLRENGDQAPADVLNILNPRADVAFLGRRDQFDLNYDGGFLLYRDNSTLNGYFQHANLAMRRLLTPHVSFFVNDSASVTPTTELVQLVAVPFINTGSRFNMLTSGIDAALSKYTTPLNVFYDFQWVRFDQNDLFSEFLRGGHSNGAHVLLKHAISPTTSLTADYDIQHALVVGGTFDVQNNNFGAEHTLSDQTKVFGAVGISRLGVSDFGPARTGPALRAGIVHQDERVNVDVTYSRLDVPAFGFGGTYQNEEVAGHLSAPITHRVYLQSSVAWRRNDPLTTDDLSLRSIWVEGVVGYAFQPWMRLEVFYAGTHQTIDRPGGELGRNRIGFQIVTAKPVRVR